MTEKDRETIRKKLRIRRVRKRVFSFFKISLLWLIGGLVILWVSGFFFIAPIAKGKISKLCGGAVYVKSGRFKGFGGIRIKGVIIAEDDEGLVDTPVFRFDEIDVNFAPWKLLRGKFEVGAIQLSDFLFNAIYQGNDEWNFSSFSIRHSDTTSQKIPLVEIHNGAMRICRLEESRPKVITTVSLNGQIAAQTGKKEYSFLLSTDGRFGFGDSTLQGLLKIGASGEKSRFSVAGNIHMPKTKVFENAWNLDNVQLECAFDRRQVVLNRCEFTMGAGRFNIHGSVQENAENRQELNLDVNLDNLSLSDHYEQNAIIYSEPVLELLDPRLRRFLNRYHPTGTGDAELTIQGYLDDLSATVVDGMIVCRDISVRPEKFPYLMENLQGNIELTGRGLELKGLKARHRDVDLVINASIHNLGPKAEIDLQMTSPNMLFDSDLYHALNESVKGVWLSFTPSGKSAIDYHFNRSEDGTKEFSLMLELKKTDLVYKHFPYPLENLTGMVLMESDCVELNELVSHYNDDRKVTLNGQVFELNSSQPNFKIHVQADQIPVDDLLIEAMPSSQQGFFDKLDIDAVATIEVDVFPNIVGKRFWDYIARVEVNGKDFVYSDFPVPLEDVHLKAEVTHEVVRLKRFEGRSGGGKVLMSGELLPKGVDTLRPGLCLDLNLEAFDFNETFWATAGKKLQGLLGKLRFQGKMDVNGHLTRNMPENSCSSTDLMIQCSDNPILWDSNPLGLADGQVHLMNDQVLFKAFTLSDVSLESVPDELLNGKLKTIYSKIEPQGKADFRVEDGTLHMDEDGPEQVDVEGGVTLKSVMAGHEGVVSDLTGEIDGQLYFDRRKNKWQILAAYDIDHFKYRHWQASNIRGNLAYDPNTQYLESSEFIADFYGGKMIGHLVVDLSEEESIGYKMGLSINEVDIPQLLEAQGRETLGHVKQGLVHGTLNLAGDFQIPSQSRGKVTANILNMKLGKQSLLGTILTAVQFKQPDEYVFSEIQSEAFIRGPELIIEDLRMVGKPLVFRGTGKVDLEQKQMQMDLVAFDRLLGTEDTILDLLARGIGSAVWKIEVRGALDNPKVDAVFLSVLKQPLELFKKKE